jgi:hypothetical protein
MFHVVVFVMMSRRLSDQSEIDHHKRRRQAGEACSEPAPGNAPALQIFKYRSRQWESVVLPASGRTRAA